MSLSQTSLMQAIIPIELLKGILKARSQGLTFAIYLVHRLDISKLAARVVETLCCSKTQEQVADVCLHSRGSCKTQGNMDRVLSACTLAFILV